jgi:hypothetical protein
MLGGALRVSQAQLLQPFLWPFWRPCRFWARRLDGVTLAFALVRGGDGIDWKTSPPGHHRPPGGGGESPLPAERGHHPERMPWNSPAAPSA